MRSVCRKLSGMFSSRLIHAQILIPLLSQLLLQDDHLRISMLRNVILKHGKSSSSFLLFGIALPFSCKLHVWRVAKTIFMLMAGEFNRRRSLLDQFESFAGFLALAFLSLSFSFCYIDCLNSRDSGYFVTCKNGFASLICLSTLIRSSRQGLISQEYLLISHFLLLFLFLQFLHPIIFHLLHYPLNAKSVDIKVRQTVLNLLLFCLYLLWCKFFIFVLKCQGFCSFYLF